MCVQSVTNRSGRRNDSMIPLWKIDIFRCQHSKIFLNHRKHFETKAKFLTRAMQGRKGFARTCGSTVPRLEHGRGHRLDVLNGDGDHRARRTVCPQNGRRDTRPFSGGNVVHFNFAVDIVFRAFTRNSHDHLLSTRLDPVNQVRHPAKPNNFCFGGGHS